MCSYTTAIVSITACLAHALKKCTQSGNFQFDVKSPSDPTRLLCQMQANSSGAEFLSTISKFMKRMNFVIACLRPSKNVKLGIFTGSRAVDGKDSRYPGALPPLLENFRPTFSPDPTDCPWVTEDGRTLTLLPNFVG